MSFPITQQRKVIQLKDDLLIYAKIGKINIQSDNPFLVPDKEKNKIKYIVQSHKNNSEKITTEYEFEKVFLENDEYSYIYEEIAINTVSNSINKVNSFFLSYGETSSEKHKIILGDLNCAENLNTRGILPRLLSQLTSRDDLTIAVSAMAIFDNHLIDIPKNINTNSPRQLLDSSLIIKQDPKIIEKITKQYIKTNDDLNNLLKDYNKFFSFIIGAENEKEKKLQIYTFSHFLYVIYISDKSNEPLSNITLCELAGNDQFVTNVINEKVSKENHIQNTKAIIENTNTVECLKKAIKSCKKYLTYTSRENKNIEERDGFDAKLLFLLKGLVFKNIDTNFRVVGCLLPNSGMQESTKDTLNFLFQLRKIILSRQINFETIDVNNLEGLNKDEIISALEKKCTKNERQIKDLNEQLEEKTQRNFQIQENYHAQLNEIKRKFNFDGDLNVLLGGGENTKEAKKARRIRECIELARSRERIINELEQKNKELLNKIEQLKNCQQIEEKDELMAEYYINVQAKRAQEENNCKLKLSNNKEIQDLKNQNSQLMKRCEVYKKDIEAKDKLIQGFQEIIDDKKLKVSNEAELRENIKKELEKNFNSELKECYKMYKREKRMLMKEKDNLISQKDSGMLTMKDSAQKIISSLKEEEMKYSNESSTLLEMIMNLFSAYEKYFNKSVMKNIAQNHPLYIAKEKFDRVVEGTQKNLHILNFPKVFGNYTKSKDKFFVSKAEEKESVQRKISKNKKFLVNNSMVETTMQLKQKITILENENEKLKALLNELSKKEERSPEAFSMDEEDKDFLIKKYLKDANDMRKKLSEVTKVNQKNEILLHSQRRSIESLTRENFFQKIKASKKNAFRDSSVKKIPSISAYRTVRPVTALKKSSSTGNLM